MIVWNSDTPKKIIRIIGEFSTFPSLSTEFSENLKTKFWVFIFDIMRCSLCTCSMHPYSDFWLYEDVLFITCFPSKFGYSFIWNMWVLRHLYLLLLKSARKHNIVIVFLEFFIAYWWIINKSIWTSYTSSQVMYNVFWRKRRLITIVKQK